MVHARPPSPRPAPRTRERETDIDISLSKNRTEVDIQRSSGRQRSRSRERRPYYEEDLVVTRDMNSLVVDDSKRTRQRARSAAPHGSRVDEEAEYITSRMDARGHMGEARGGATRNWTIVDVPPGTERVRMNGAGGASTDTTWTNYSGVRRTQFIPDRDRSRVTAEIEPAPARDRERVSVAVNNYEREREIDIVTDRRITRAPAEPPAAVPRELWTEITKDLVSREAIIQLGYDFEETPQFYYIMDYLRYVSFPVLCSVIQASARRLTSTAP